MQLGNRIVGTLVMCTLVLLGGCKYELNSYAYVSIASSNEVLVVDQKKAEIVEQIPVGAGPAIIIATPNNKKAYTANWGDNTVSAIDTDSNQATNIAMPGRPYIIAMAPQGDYVYAGLYPDKIAVIDTQTDTVERIIPSEIFPASMFVSPDGETLYLATTAVQPGLAWAISAQTGEITQPLIEVGLAPGWITMNIDGSKLYALNYYSDDVSVIDTEQWIVEETIPTGEGSKGIIGNVTPDNKTLYVTNFGTAELIAIDVNEKSKSNSDDTFSKIPLPGRPVGVHFNRLASKLYVTDYGPESVADEGDTGSVFLNTGVWTSTNPGYLSIIHGRTKEIINRVETPSGPTSVVGITKISRKHNSRKPHSEDRMDSSVLDTVDE